MNKGLHRLQFVKDRATWGRNEWKWHVHWRDGFNEMVLTLESINVECMSLWEFGLRWLPWWRGPTEPDIGPTNSHLFNHFLTHYQGEPYRTGDKVQVRLFAGSQADSLDDLTGNLGDWIRGSIGYESQHVCQLCEPYGPEVRAACNGKDNDEPVLPE